MAESELNAGQRYSADLDDDDSSAGESTEDEEEAERARVRGQDEDERGMVDESMLSGAAQARKLFVSRGGAGKTGSSAALAGAGADRDKERAPLTTMKTEGGAAVPVKSALKRSRDEASSGDLLAVKEEGTGSGAKVAKVSFNQPGAGASAASAPAADGPAAGTGGAGTQQAAEEYPLTEQGFRLFMRHRGGKVLPSDMNVSDSHLNAHDALLTVPPLLSWTVFQAPAEGVRQSDQKEVSATGHDE